MGMAADVGSLNFFKMSMALPDMFQASVCHELSTSPCQHAITLCHNSIGV